MAGGEMAIERMTSSITQRIGFHLTAIAAVVTVGLWIWPTLAGDVFRTRNARPIDDRTQAAFEAVFKEGNYPAAEGHLRAAESSEENEPLTYAMLASFSYLNSDWKGLKSYATKTMAAAKKLSKDDPLRSKLYTGVGHFLEGVYIFQQEGSIAAIPKLQQVFQYLDEAEQIAPDDPELNLLKGYMDLMLAVNLPFSDPNQAIDRLENYAAPSYLADRGIALGYRDLKQHDKALTYVNRALKEAPNHPELYYLKAQIEVGLGKQRKDSALLSEAQQNFQLALNKSDRLPKGLVAQIFYEQCQNKNRLEKENLDCRSLQNSIKRFPGIWGAEKLPSLE
jgi:tetratricopeptide (TPR) repeat protein